MVLPISQTYIEMIKAFRADCEILIEKFKSVESNNTGVDEFLEIWNNLNFACIYERKFSINATEHEFKIDTLQISKLIMLREHFMGGMFLMYGLFCLQDYPPGIIRLQLSEFKYICDFLKIKKEDPSSKNHQLVWIFCKLLKEEAFEYVFFGREYDMEGQYRAEMIYNNKYDFSDDDNPKTVKPKDWLREFSKTLPEEMAILDRKFLKMKAYIKSAFPDLNLSLDIVQKDINTVLLRSLTQADSMEEPWNADSIGVRRQGLKNRKMKIRNRYKRDVSDEESAPYELLTKVKGKPRRMRGERKYFFDKAINEPDTDSTSDSEDSVLFASLSKQPGLPELF